MTVDFTLYLSTPQKFYYKQIIVLNPTNSLSVSLAAIIPGHSANMVSLKLPTRTFTQRSVSYKSKALIKYVNIQLNC